MADQTAALLSPFLRSQRLKAARPLLQGDVLDFGCGVGLLAQWVEPERYLGLDIDAPSLDKARAAFPRHTFTLVERLEAWPELLDGRRFDTLVALALIEHVKDPAGFLRSFASVLKPGGSIVLTTPNPALGWAHQLGARVGLFSKEADDEHEELLGFRRMREVSADAGLELASARRFLFGANQLFVVRPPASATAAPIGAAAR